jgi:mannose-6-phosphate isomerase
LVERRSIKPLPARAALDAFQRRVEKPWGWESIWAENEAYTGKLIHVQAGKRLSLQYHDDKLETQCLLSGRAILVLEDSSGELHEIEMRVGQGYNVCPYQTHRLIALEDCDVVEVSTPERGTTVRIEDDFRRLDETEAVRALPDRGWQPASKSALRPRA